MARVVSSPPPGVMSRTPDTIHIIFSSGSGAGRSFTFSRRRLRRYSLISITCLLLLAIGSWKGFIFSHQNLELSDKLAETNAQLEDLSTNFTTELDRKEMELLAAYQSRIEMLTGELDEVNSALDNSNRRHGDMVQQYERQLTSLRRDHESALEQTISRLNERSQAIESMMDRIGVSVKSEKSDKKGGASGGPFIAVQPDTPQKLLQQSGRYLELLKKTPLGQPVNGRIGSGFGHRSDPFSGKEAFHSGIDFEGSIGSRVVATADGVVAEVTFDKGGYGNFVRIRHGNGYETLYAHLHKPEIRSGETVKRGQLIGQLGNTGRSTGPHVHYEILLNGQPINPAKYIAASTTRRPRTR